MRRRRYDELDPHAIQALYAGKYLAMRDHWLGLAEKAAKGSDERGSHITFAKCAHRAYMNDLTRALDFQRRALIRRAKELLR